MELIQLFEQDKKKLTLVLSVDPFRDHPWIRSHNNKSRWHERNKFLTFGCHSIGSESESSANGGLASDVWLSIQ